MQHKRDPLGGSQRFEHDEHRKTDRIGYPRILGHTTTAVDMPKLMIEMFHISSK